MRKIILQEFVTLDGLATGPNDSTDFVPGSMQGDKGFQKEQLKLMKDTDTLLLGRVTYQMFAGYWPGVRKGPDKTFADKINKLTKIVFSKTLKTAPWGDELAKVIKSAAAKEVPKLKKKPGKNIVIWGSLSIAQALTKAGLIDEYRLVVCPVILGTGRSLFEEKVDALGMKLVEVKTFKKGAVQLKYKPDSAKKINKKRK